jgi:hypothetical protein
MATTLKKLILISVTSISGLLSNGAWASACSSTVSPYAMDCDASGITWTLGSLTVNSGVVLTGTANLVISNTSSTFINNGTIVNTTSGDKAVVTTGSITSVTNNGTINGSSSAFQNTNSGILGAFINNGTLTSANIGFYNFGVITNFTNAGSINAAGYNLLNQSGAHINTLINSGSIGSVGVNGNGISNWRGVIDSLINSGTITVSNGHVAIDNVGGVITSFTNTGSIIVATGGYGILNVSYPNVLLGPDTPPTLTTLNNLQGAGNTAGALAYTGILPTNYNIIINSASQYGRLAGSSVTGATAFGIYAGSLITSRIYTGVLQGLSDSNVGATRTGNYDGMDWTLAISSGTSWDLTFTGASLVGTQASLHNSAQRMRSVFNTAAISTNFANMNTYDCNLFDTKGMCISAGGRYTTVDNPSSNSSSAVVVVGYKATPNIRIGGFLDQNFNNTTPTGIHIANKNPMMGAFAVWNKNEDGTGVQVKVANAYQDKDVTTTRDVIGTSEAGTGSTKLNTQSYVGELSYAFTFKDKTLVRPYLALRHTTIKQDGYTEDTTALVTAPLTYAALEDKSTAALLGIKLNHALTPKANLTVSLGIEQDLSHKVDQYAASGVSGLTSENFNDNIKHTRPVASLGAYYALTKTQRISGDVYYQQLPFQSTGSTTAYFNYTIGL